MLCKPRTHFTAAELRELNDYYAAAPIWAKEFDSWRWNPVAAEHCADAWNVMQAHPAWEVPLRVVAILNGDTGWRRAIGFKLYDAFTVGTRGCECCIGWRALVGGLLCGASGAALLHLLQGL